MPTKQTLRRSRKVPQLWMRIVNTSEDEGTAETEVRMRRAGKKEQRKEESGRAGRVGSVGRAESDDER